ARIYIVERDRPEQLDRLCSQEPLPLSRNAALQEERSDLIDDAGALADQSLTHAVKRLQVELFNGLRRHKPHRRALHRLSDRLRIPKIVLLSLRVGPNILRRHQSRIVPKRFELATEVMRADTSLHSDQARRHIG